MCVQAYFMRPKPTSCGQRRLWSDWADAQADLSLRRSHMSFCWFCHALAHFHFLIHLLGHVVWLIRQLGRFLDLSCVFENMHPAKTQINLCGCIGWSGAHFAGRACPKAFVLFMLWLMNFFSTFPRTQPTTLRYLKLQRTRIFSFR